jgi:UDPglucose--hexose-1-phosphate uridylyltransferase
VAELRQDALTGEWTIVAPERGGGRRDDYEAEPPRPRPVAHDPSCPFCPGNEARSPDELARLPDQDGWRVRVVANKYPMLGEPGAHEVVVESPRHDDVLWAMDDDHLGLVLRAYRDRERAQRAREGVAHVVLYKNHGPEAGTSLMHPHAQLVALPVVPELVARVDARLAAHRATIGRRLLHDLVADALSDGARVAAETERFVLLAPHAPSGKHEAMVVPTEPRPAFADVPDADLSALTSLLGRVLRRLRDGLDQPSYNLAFRSAPTRGALDAWVWWLQILPRTSTLAGFQMGTGMRVTTVPPEETAALYRHAGP